MKTAWQQSLDDRLMLGWRNQSQTEEIVRTACLKAYLFGDGLHNISAIVQELMSLPGYNKHCDRQSEITAYVAQWMEVIRQSWPRRRSKVQTLVLQEPLPPKKVRERPKSTKRRDEVMSRLRQTVAALAEQPLPHRFGDIVEMIQSTAKEMFGQSFGTNTMYHRQYRNEWRILIEIAHSQSHNQESCEVEGSPAAMNFRQSTTLHPSLSHKIASNIGKNC